MEVLAADQRIALTARDLFPLTIHADERLLKQLVVNLLNNALVPSDATSSSLTLWNSRTSRPNLRAWSPILTARSAPSTDSNPG